MKRRSLERRLVEGTGPRDPAIAEALGVDAGDELGLARALVAAVGAPLAGGAEGWSPSELLVPRVSSDGSFLARLSVESTGTRLGVDRLDDAGTLVAVLRGGSLRQRRAAVRRLGELAAGLEADDLRRIDEALSTVRDEDLALEVARLRARLGVIDPGDLEREDAHARRLLAELEVAIPRFYESDHEPEPFSAMDAESRALVGGRLRWASDEIAAHVGAVLEGSVGVSDELRVGVLSALRTADDPRLTAILGALLESPVRDLALEAARALGRVESPAAHVLLAAAYGRRTTPADRAVLAGMLGLQGDVSQLAELRETMRAEDPRARLAAVEAIGPIATSEDFEPLASLLGSGSLALDRAVIRSLGSLGDARAVRLLRGVRATDRGAALAIDIDGAMRAVRAQMELRGEKDVPESALEPVLTRAESPWWARAVAAWHIAVATVLARLGLQRRALRRLDRAIVRARDLASPWVVKGRILEARSAHAEALVVFRRAIEIDRRFVERRPIAVRSVARAFLRRAEAMRREGRRDLARGLLDEVLALDLRLVSGPLRQAIHQEREKLAREEGA
jgi:tetratricopeptide (TPR) repeat protein